MLDEDPFRRPQPQTPYNYNGKVLEISPLVIEATRALLQRAGQHEACVFWYGERGEQRSVVRSVRAPRQRSNARNYLVEPEWLSEMVLGLPASWRPLAQVHSHPGIDTEHSRYDDEMISSKKVLSLVLPTYALRQKPWPQGVGVHEWQSNYWHMLQANDIASRIQVRGGEIEVRDFR
jgi:hypothetical protein